MARQGENIYQRKDGRWEGKYVKERKSGKIHYGYVSGKNYEDVLQKKRKKLCEITQGNSYGSSVSLLVSSVSEKWMESGRGTLKETTLAKYSSILKNHIIPEYGNRQVNDIPKDEVHAWLMGLLQGSSKESAGMSAKSVNSVASVLRLVFRFAKAEYNVSVPDIEKLHMKQNKKQITVLSQNEQEILEKYLMENMDLGNLGIMTCLYTGIRLGDYCVIISLNQLEAAK